MAGLLEWAGEGDWVAALFVVVAGEGEELEGGGGAGQAEVEGAGPGAGAGGGEIPEDGVVLGLVFGAEAAEFVVELVQPGEQRGARWQKWSSRW